MPRPVNNKKIPTNQSAKSTVSTLLSLVVLAVLVGGFLTNQNRIFDYWKLRNYQPPATVAQLATDTSMTAYTRHLFYLNKPQILSTVKSFRQFCPENRDTIVLGCYHSSQAGIYIYDVPDKSLAGVQQVTTAHEALHAAYGRLSGKDKTKVNAMLRDYYEHGLTDPLVKNEIKLYMTTEPNSVTDEMHSLFGTELAQLPGPLEQYYRQYFSNRAKIVGYQQQYQAQFTERQNAIAEDDKQLDQLKAKIAEEQSNIDARLARLSEERSRINGYASSNQVAAYNAAVPSFNAQIDAYNNAVQRLKADIDTFNELVVARNAIAGQLATLDKALDTRTTAPISH